ncbi:TPA: shikimate dehydrogenase [Streptococcus pyogenes]|uniref:shikimate dehydrogenase n=1 Tax=Streptococcus pyogenes TaxID=1314 RepID=UPI0000F09260|nr:shikimate dehydrogenase [Streptococcus pyogenes]HER4661386.1 shikimate dehydrogenase [Streptococcus pyogenes NGAS428]HER4780522.1 shikimate dehydrogenase [Streptococcus pyogenes NGAS148]NSX74342.1 shikimate dehydrogenase [Streptococcus pyogenes]NSX77801.1 shikimate dehydrogenase [Streptococcus pyogenes]NTS60492.1 shikimate dehydrogenase [Streptococcus pyogenes]
MLVLYVSSKLIKRRRMKFMYSALLGNPVEHSISDELFEYLNHNIGVLDEYKHKKILVDSVCLEDKIKHLINDPKCIGLNITLPYKREVMRYIDNLDRVAEITGSVNNIYKSGNIITGTNTDWKGIYNTLVFFNISHITKCCVLGTGGTARAAIFTLQKLQISPTVVYREPISENTRSLIKSFPDLKYITYKELADQQILNDMEIIINTTPVGMINYEESLPINFDHLDNVNYKDKYFMDVVFNPLQTKLHEYFGKKGAKIIDGLWVLIFQGIEAFSLWSDKINDGKYFFSKDDVVLIHTFLEGKIKGK